MALNVGMGVGGKQVSLNKNTQRIPTPKNRTRYPVRLGYPVSGYWGNKTKTSGPTDIFST